MSFLTENTTVSIEHLELLFRFKAYDGFFPRRAISTSVAGVSSSQMTLVENGSVRRAISAVDLGRRRSTSKVARCRYGARNGGKRLHRLVHRSKGSGRSKASELSYGPGVLATCCGSWCSPTRQTRFARATGFVGRQRIRPGPACSFRG